MVAGVAHKSAGHIRRVFAYCAREQDHGCNLRRQLNGPDIAEAAAAAARELHARDRRADDKLAAH